MTTRRRIDRQIIALLHRTDAQTSKFIAAENRRLREHRREPIEALIEAR